MNVNLLKQQFYAIAVLMNWIDNDVAAREVMLKSSHEPPTEQIRVSFATGGNVGNVNIRGEVTNYRKRRRSDSDVV